MTASTPDPISVHLDITRDICPITFVKTKLELEEMSSGQLLEVLVREGESLDNVARSCEEEGHVLLSREKQQGEVWRLVIMRADE